MIDAQTLRGALDFERVYAGELGKIHGRTSERNAICPFHDDSRPSLGVNIEKGVYRCPVCSADGDVFTLVEKMRGCTFPEAAEYLRSTYAPHISDGSPMPYRPKMMPAVQKALPPIPQTFASECHERLLADDSLLEFLTVKRGLTIETIQSFELGHDGKRYTIPIRDDNGVLVNVRRYKPGGDPKMLPFARGYGEARIFPAIDPATAAVYVFGGEFDMMRARQDGYEAYTGTSGESTWLPEWNERFRGRHVVIVYDCDQPGRDGAARVARSLYGIAAGITIVDLGLPGDGDDYTDFVVTYERDDFFQLAINTPEWTPAESPATGGDDDDEPSRRAPVLSDIAIYGPLGDWVRLTEEHTEASRAALLFNALAAVGCLIGRSPFSLLDGARHGVNLFVLTVGSTSSGRKGTSEKRVRSLLRDLDDDFGVQNVASGLNSGQGLIHHLRDARPGVGDKAGDPGVTDKRLLVIEPEFSAVLRQVPREGNIVSPIIREAWDAYGLRTLVKGDPLRATDPHVAIVAQITPEELRRYIDDISFFNGFINRFLFCWTERARLLPFGSSPDSREEAGVISRVRHAVSTARQVGNVSDFTLDAREWWASHYEALTTGRSGRVGAATQRAAAQVRRVALLFAALDGAHVLGVEHLEAAFAVWQYAEESAAYIIGRESLSTRAMKVGQALRSAGEDGLTRTAIRDDVLGSHSVNRAAVDAVLDELRDAGIATGTTVPTAGRSREVWALTEFGR